MTTTRRARRGRTPPRSARGCDEPARTSPPGATPLAVAARDRRLLGHRSRVGAGGRRRLRRAVVAPAVGADHRHARGTPAAPPPTAAVIPAKAGIQLLTHQRASVVPIASSVLDPRFRGDDDEARDDDE